MKVLLVHPSPLIFSESYLWLEPLGIECIATAAEQAGCGTSGARPTRAQL